MYLKDLHCNQNKNNIFVSKSWLLYTQKQQKIYILSNIHVLPVCKLKLFCPWSAEKSFIQYYQNKVLSSQTHDIWIKDLNFDGYLYNFKRRFIEIDYSDNRRTDGVNLHKGLYIFIFSSINSEKIKSLWSFFDYFFKIKSCFLLSNTVFKLKIWFLYKIVLLCNIWKRLKYLNIGDA